MIYLEGVFEHFEEIFAEGRGVFKWIARLHRRDFVEDIDAFRQFIIGHGLLIVLRLQIDNELMVQVHFPNLWKIGHHQVRLVL